MSFSKAILDRFGKLYAAAWSSGDPDRVANCFTPGGVIQINGDVPAIGRAAVRQVAQEYMESFPDLQVSCDQMTQIEGELRWYWTMKGCNTGPGGTGKSVFISGYEAIELDDEHLIVSAIGHFDEQDFDSQLTGGTS